MARPSRYPPDIKAEFNKAQDRARPIVAFMLAAIVVGAVGRPSVKDFAQTWPALTLMTLLIQAAVIATVRYQKALWRVNRKAREYRQVAQREGRW